MERSEIKRRARGQISGNIGTLFLISFIVNLMITPFSTVTMILFMIGILSMNLAFIFFGLVVLLVGSVLIGGVYNMSMAFVYKGLSQGRKAQVGDVAYGFKDFGRATGALLLQSLFIGLWYLIPFVGWIIAIVKSYSYSMTYYILLDNPQLTVNDAITESRRMMNGNKGRLFVQQLSFLGWILLSGLLFYIPLIWVEPYMQAATYNFYLDVSGANNVQIQPQEQPQI